ncbi:hypothetical protein LP422_00710 [Janibacter limosus]|uniref:Uncharacterized protein n=1 Tax=Janibacter limosus TaxID=53458 RepID=A0AC61U4I8_9MICO|nr:hypothetical protein [Janibacter limosus]UUZ44949.1 hypothetical protein LP422_00710 [Janibacter limosus]
MTSSGEASAHTPLRWRSTRVGLKTKKVAATVPGETAPIGAEREAK